MIKDIEELYEKTRNAEERRGDQRDEEKKSTTNKQESSYSSMSGID